MKKVLCAFLVLVMLMSLLTGCGDNKSALDDTIKLKWLVPGVKQQDMQRVMTEFNTILMEKLNCEVELEVSDFGSFDERMNVAISSNEYFDICFTSNWINKYLPAVSMGAYLPINDLLDKYGQNIKENIPEVLLNNATVNGKLYAIPNYQISYSNYGAYIPKDLADKYGLDPAAIPQGEGVTTLKALEPFMQKIVDNEPGLIPFRPNYLVLPLDYENLLAFNHGGIYVDETTDKPKVVSFAEDPKLIDCYAFYKDWYQKGYIRKDIASTAENDLADQKNQKYAIQVQIAKPGALEQMELSYGGREYIEIIIDQRFVSADAGLSTMNAISINSKYPELCMQFLNLINDPNDTKLYNMICHGIEGTDYNKLEGNYIEVIADSGYNPGADWVFGNQFNSYLLSGQNPDDWEKTIEYNINSKTSPLAGFHVDLNEIKSEEAQVRSVVEEYRYAWAYDDFDKVIAERNEKLKAAGIDTVITKVQAQIDEYLAQAK